MIADATIARCASTVGPVTMAAIVSYESGRHPYAIGDNTAHRSYFPASHEAAVRIATSLLRAGDDIDVGYAQINAANFAAYHLTVETALEKCSNLAVGARILTEDYRRAVRAYGPGQRALAHALSAYNAGALDAGAAYARAVWSEGLRLRGAPPVRAVAIVHADTYGRILVIHRASGPPEARP